MVPQSSGFTPVATDAGHAVHQAAMQQAHQLLQYMHSGHRIILATMLSLNGAPFIPTVQQANDMILLHQLGMVQPSGQGYTLTLLGDAVLAMLIHQQIMLIA